MNYHEWEASVPDTIRQDSLWKAKAYKQALFAADVGWQDVTKLTNDPRTKPLAAQLYQALGSISANIAEGYSRGTSKERAHFYEYALGSAREAKDWYYKARHVLGADVAEHRLEILTEVIRLLLAMIPEQRGHVIREETVDYLLDAD